MLASIWIPLLFCASAAGQDGRIYVSDEGTNSIAVVDPVSNSVIASIPLSGTPGIAAAIPSGERIFVPLRSSNQIAVIEAASNTVIATINDASLAEPSAAAVFAGRGEVWVVNRVGGPGGNGSITVIDVNSLLVTRTVTSPSFAAPEHLAVAPSGSQIYVVNTGDGTLLQILASNYSVSFSVAVGASPRFAVVGPGGRFIYVANEGSSNFSIVDMVTRDMTFVATPGSPRSMALPAGSSVLFIALQNNLVGLYDIPTQVLSTVAFPNPFVSHAVTLQAGTRYAYVSDRNAGTVASFDTLTRMPSGVAGNPVAGLSAPRALFSTGVVTAADLSLSLAGAPPTALGGEAVNYNLEVSNAGPSTATDARLTLELSAPFELLSTSPGQGSCRLAQRTVICDLGSLEFRTTVAVSVRLAIIASGAVAATAQVEAEQPDPIPGNNAAMATTVVTASADLAISITDQPDPVSVGGLLVYSVTILNRGPSRADGVRFFDPLPSGVLLDSLDAGLGNCLAGDTSILCNLESIPSGQSLNLEIRVVPLMPGNLLNGVDVRSVVNDPDLSNNAAVALTTVRGGSSDLAIAKSVSSPVANPGEDVLYELVATNLGPDQAGNVQVTDRLPAGLEFVATPGDDAACEFRVNLVACRIDRLAAGDSRIFIIQARVNAAVGEALTNTAEIANPGVDGQPANNQAAASVRVVARGDLNGDGALDAADVQALALEINDGDGEAVVDAAGGSYPGNATMDLNGDGSINRADLAVLVELIFGG